MPMTIAYFSLGAIQLLPPPIEMPKGQVARHQTRNIPNNTPKTKWKRKPRCEEEGDVWETDIVPREVGIVDDAARENVTA